MTIILREKKTTQGALRIRQSTMTEAEVVTTLVLLSTKIPHAGPLSLP